ncbi:3-hydroxyacyl-CoA dehydrogenase, NAD binding domain, partial [Ignavigranum ruoffiae]
MSQIKTVGVVGAGSMGSGIANAFAMNGYQVILRDIKEEFLQGGLQRIEKFMEKSVQRGKLSQEDKEATLGRIQTTTELADFKEVDFVVE